MSDTRAADGGRWDVVVAGGGPAGLMAAIEAAGRGKRVVVLEKNPEPGRKLLLTGQGRCNLTNLSDPARYCEHYHNGAFLRNGFHRFAAAETVAFFEANGLAAKVEESFRVFPAAGGARAVREALLRAAAARGAAVAARASVRAVARAGDGFETATAAGTFRSAKVVIACGGRSYPQTGSSGDGEGLAAALGHTIVPAVPALCGVETPAPFIGAWQGVNLRSAGVSARVGDGRPFASTRGDIVFTDRGVSGPGVLNIGGDIAERAGGGGVRLVIDFRPDEKLPILAALLDRAISGRPAMAIGNLLKTFIPSGLIPAFLGAAGVDGRKPSGQATRGERNAICGLLKAFPLPVARVKGFEESMSTRGGVAVGEVAPATMESRIVPGLFFAGEVLDVDGESGGYNLQAAFTTGHCAGAAV